MSTMEPWLILKQWVFSAWKTVNSIRNIRKFDPMEQINITNQPTWYTHILVKSGLDLVNLLKDIYAYNLYFTWYDEKLEIYNLYKKTLESYKINNFFDYFETAKNILLTESFYKNLVIKTKIKFWIIQTCNLSEKQLEKEIELLEKYFIEREVYTKKYWENLITGYFNFMVLDELHLYFGTRNFKDNFKWDNAFLMDFIAFPVKLNTRIEAIAQNVNTLDIMFRRQCSLYVTHESSFFWLIQSTYTYNVQDPEHPVFDENSLVSKSRSINWYNVFWYPKLQYYRNHIILANKDDSVYESWDYFLHIKNITDNLLLLEKQQEKDIKELKKIEVTEKFEQKLLNKLEEKEEESIEKTKEIKTKTLKDILRNK